MHFDDIRVLVRGGGDLASGVVYRLIKAGFPVLVTELAQPLAIRRTVAYASAVFDGTICVDGVRGRRVESVEEAFGVLDVGEVPVLVDPEGDESLSGFGPQVLVDARVAKRNLGVTRDQALLVIGLGPGFSAGEDCHAVVETQRGHALGRVLWDGPAAADTGQPGNIAGQTGGRVLRAPAAGSVVPDVQIGDHVIHGQRVASVNGEAVNAPFDGVLRGLIHPSVSVTAGMKIGDVDPRGVPAYCWTISDKALAVGGAVVEAILSASQFDGVCMVRVK